MDRSNASRRQLVIVALPSESDRVRKISSEKEPHLTLLYLGESDLDSDRIRLIAEYLEHAASDLPPFMLDVRRRGELGDDRADVLFFDTKYAKRIETFRSHLLSYDPISEAYHSTEQFPEWIPHLTLGYPETPAKKDPENPEFWYVNFDRIALWVDDYEGPTFELEYRDHGNEVALSQMDRGRSVMDSILAHYGVKGMKWGVRRSDAELSGSRAPSAKPQLSSDAKQANSLRTKVQNKGTGSLSNQEMRQLLERVELERRYSQVMESPLGKSRVDRGHEQVKRYLKMAKTYEEVRKFMETPTGQAVKTGLKTATAAGFAYATGGTSAAATAGAGVVVRRMTQ